MNFSNTAKAMYSGGSFSSNTVLANLLDNITLSKTQNGVSTPIDVVSGQQVDYQIVIKNPNSTSFSNVKFMDNIPSGMNYITGTFKVNGSTQTPTISGNVLSYIISTLPGSGSVTIDFSVTVS